MQLRNKKTSEIISHRDLAEVCECHPNTILNAIRLKGVFQKEWVCFEKQETKSNAKRKIVCVETGQIWDSISDCSRDVGCSRCYFNTHLKFSYPKTIRGKVFKYYEEV